MTVADAIKQMKRKYAGQGVATRLYVSARCIAGRYEDFLRHVPTSGQALDYGCGVGQLSLIVAMMNPAVEVCGYDLSQERIMAARKASEGISNVTFTSDKSEVPARKWNAVFFFDSLHYMTPEEQDETVLTCAADVAIGGILLIRDVNKEAGVKYAVTRLHESVMVASGLTPTNERAVYMRNISELSLLLEGAGFESVVYAPPAFHPYADYLLVAKKIREIRPVVIAK